MPDPQPVTRRQFLAGGALAAAGAVALTGGQFVSPRRRALEIAVAAERQHSADHVLGYGVGCLRL